ncbi:MAG: HD-GYP domain-containing protein [Eubacteriales bacterium]
MRLVSIQSVAEGNILAKNIIDYEGRILLRSGVELSERYINRLSSLGHDVIFIEDPDFEDVEIGTVVSEETRLEAYKSIKSITAQIEMGNGLSDDAVDSVKNIINQMIDEMLYSPDVLSNLTNIRGFDNCTYHHSINTTVIALVLGIACGLTNNTLRDLGIGVLMHDVGKIEIPLDILNKNGKLTSEEYEIVKKHSLRGYEIIKTNEDFSILSAHVALQHHERWDGSGYPRKLKKDGIHLFGRIAAVSDVYEALTGKRPYRQALQPYEAYEYILAHAGKQFDPLVVQHFVKKIAVYPTGSGVRLSNGQKGNVVRQNVDFPSRPIVRAIFGKDNSKLAVPVDYNLATNITLMIVGIDNS